MANTLLIDYLEKGLRGKSETTIKTYHHALLQFETWLQGAGTDLDGFARSDVQQYVDYLAAHKKSAATINKVFNAIKSFCRWAGKKNLVENIQCAPLKTHFYHRIGSVQGRYFNHTVTERP